MNLPSRGRTFLLPPLIELAVLRRTLILTFFLTGGVAAVAIGAGCSNLVSSSSGDSGATPSTSGAGNDAVVFLDGGTKASAPAVSRLCSLAQMCLPDDDGTFTPSGFRACATPVDGGLDIANHANGCRIVADATATCFSDGGTDRNGVDGAACGTGSDCAPGFDCILGTGNRAAVCRRYCCAGASACDDHMSQNGGKTFCDIQSLAESSTLVPVCMPLKQCTLLKAKECTLDETCAIVTDKGDTGCVATGPVTETNPCDEAHCAAGLTCLGSAGERQCYVLCRVDDSGSAASSGCKIGQTCTTGSLFPDTTYGVCR